MLKKSRRFTALLAVATLLAAGCGTIGNMSRLSADHITVQMGQQILTDEGKRLTEDMSPVYGGVRLDCRFIQDNYTRDVPDGDTLADRLDFAGRNSKVLLLVTLDLPLSAALDTVLLPVTLTCWLTDKPLSAATPPPAAAVSAPSTRPSPIPP